EASRAVYRSYLPLSVGVPGIGMQAPAPHLPAILPEAGYLRSRLLVTPMGRRGRRRGLDGRERLQNLVGVRRPLGHDPRVARFEADRLSFQIQFRPAADDVADRFVVAAGRLLAVAGRLVLPEPHGQMNSRRQVLLAHS